MVGSVLSNRYELLENIGAGGMAIVYKARCRLLNRYVAVKILRPEFQEDEEFLKRFTIEAQAAASLSHPNVVSVYDVGRHGKLSYIVMECIEGITLKEYMTKKETLSVNEAVDFTMQIASALEHAHAKGIIHRDIKPHNIIITNEGVLKVTDFGLARAVTKSTTVASASAIGSVHYVSPEQARGGYTDQRSDIYSLGIVMYEMFTGKLPFDSDTPVAVAMKHLEEEPQKPTELNPQIPADVEAIILKALQKDVKERYASVAELLQAFRKVCGMEEISAHNDKFSTRKLPKLTDHQKEAKPKEEPKKKRMREDTVAVVAAIGTAVLIVVVLAVLFAGKMFPGQGRKEAEINVPSLLNMSIEDALIRYPNLLIEEHSAAYSSTIPKGFIISQDKAAETKIRANEIIGVTVSRGAQVIELEDYTGEDYRVAERELKALDLVPQISEEHSDDVREGVVVRQNPAAGYELKTGATVILYVSKGKSDVEVEVPSLIGKTEEEARNTLKTHDLKLGSVEEVADNAEKGTVVRQSVRAGEMISTDTAINIIISSGPSEEPKQNGVYTLRLELPLDKPSVSVRVTSEGKTLLEGTFETALSPVTLNLTDAVGTSTVDIYFDDVLYKSGIPVTFS